MYDGETASNAYFQGEFIYENLISAFLNDDGSLSMIFKKGDSYTLQVSCPEEKISFSIEEIEDQLLGCGDEIPQVPQLTATSTCADDVFVSFEESEDMICQDGFLITRTWYASDDCGNTASISYQITITDSENPIAQLLPESGLTIDLTLGESIPSVAVFGQDIIFNDNCDSELEMQFEESEVDRTDCDYYLYRQWRVSDNCGNSSGYSQWFHVIECKPESTVEACEEISIMHECPWIVADDVYATIEPVNDVLKEVHYSFDGEKVGEFDNASPFLRSTESAPFQENGTYYLVTNVPVPNSLVNLYTNAPNYFSLTMQLKNGNYVLLAAISEPLIEGSGDDGVDHLYAHIINANGTVQESTLIDGDQIAVGKLINY